MAESSQKERRSLPISFQSHKNPFSAIQQEFERVFDRLHHWFEPTSAEATKEKFEDLGLVPSMDLVEDKDTFKIELEMPGMGHEDIKLSVNNNVLTIQGHKKTSRKDEGKNYLMREIWYGEYSRSVTLPNTVDLDKISATFRKGMLWITIPKIANASKQQQKEIKIEAV